MSLPLDPRLAYAQLRVDELHRQAAHARLIAAARAGHTPGVRVTTPAALRRGAGRPAAVPALRPHSPACALARPAGPAVQPCH